MVAELYEAGKVESSKRRYRELYDNHDVQLVLDSLLDGQAKKLEPTFELEYGARYRAVENLTGLPPRNALDLLRRMSAGGLLEAKVMENVMACSSCRSVNVATKPICPNCRSVNITLQRTVEHVSCGFADLEGEFVKEDDSLTCPDCGAKASANGPQFRINDDRFSCEDCEKTSLEPLMVYDCRGCGHTMTLRDIDWVNVYSFGIGPSVDIASVVRTSQIRDILTSLGYSVENESALTGTSGVRHQCDILAAKNDSRIAINFAYSNSVVGEVPMVRFFAAKIDTGLKRCILVAVPAADEQAKKLAQQYGIVLIEGSDMGPLIERLKNSVVSWERVEQSTPA